MVRGCAGEATATFHSALRNGLEEGKMQIGVETTRAVENKRVFIVDHDEITRAALQFMLHDENEAHEIPSLDAAFAKAEERKPDLLLLGAGIVEENGVGLLEELAARIPGVRVLLVSDAATNAFAQSCLKSGAHGVLAKPFTVESVRGKVDILLGRGGGANFVPLQVLTGRPQ
jgi:DNA-binding response OmpR family regulator